jgi:ABC-type phosphate/phosphonate transport system substrate-binding protein
MYDLPEVREATDALWSALARGLRERGERDVPDALDRTRGDHEVWRDPALLFAQMCGFPLTHEYRGRVRVVAVPCHAIAGCESGHYQSVVVVREGSSFERPRDVRGAVLAMNDHDSHSGKYAFLACLAEEGARFSGGVRLTGSHQASLAAVSRGDADVASIDCITFALLERHRPRVLERLRVAFRTPQAPAPAYVTRADAGDDEVERLRVALSHVFEDPSLASDREALLLSRIRVLEGDAYERIVELERATGRARVDRRGQSQA